MTIQLTEAGKKYLDGNFPNGSYVEGFTFLTAEDDEGVSLSVPFLGFYGDWGGLTAFDGDPGGTAEHAGYGPGGYRHRRKRLFCRRQQYQRCV